MFFWYQLTLIDLGNGLDLFDVIVDHCWFCGEWSICILQMVKVVYFKDACNTNLVLGTQCKLDSYPQESVFEEKIRSIELFLCRGIRHPVIQKVWTSHFKNGHRASVSVLCM